MKKRLLAVLLAGVLALSACGGQQGAATTNAPAGTTQAPAATTKAPAAPATKAPETKAPETKAPETKAPETKAPETQAPTEAPTEPPAPVEKEFSRYDGKAVTLNPLEANAADNVLHTYVSARLYREWPGDDGVSKWYRPELAESDPVQMDTEGKLWQITVRQGINFVDNEGKDTGKEITAETFEYTYRMSQDPKLKMRAGDSLGTIINIVNAKQYFTQTPEAPVSWDDVGIKAIDKYTLQIATELPVNTTLVARAFCGYNTAPVEPELFESLKSADGTSTTYGTDEKSAYFSGAFYVESWVKESKEVLKRNPLYPLYDEVNWTTVNLISGGDPNARLLMFNNGELQFTDLDATLGFEYNESPLYIAVPNRYVCSIEFCDSSSFFKLDENGTPVRVELGKEGMELPILSNTNFKKAIWYAVDRTTLGKLVNGRPCTYLIPDTSMAFDDGTLFRNTPEAQAYTQPVDEAYNPELAKQYFETAMKEEGYGDSDKLTVHLLYNTAAYQKNAAAFLQEQLAVVFGADRFELALDELDDTPRLAQMKSWRDNRNAYQLAFTVWSFSSGDTMPIKALGPYASATYTRCNSPYHCEELEQIMASVPKDARLLTDQQYGVELAAKAEKAALDDPINVPLFGRTSEYLLSDEVELPIDPFLGLGFFDWLADYAE